jgi:NAD(P)-dependent dehydrogenase (short-subunit alcohol dehydrogenase family)
MKELAGKVAVITGGGSGIGRGMAHAFADAGMKVAIGDIQPEAGDRVRAELEAKGVEAMALPLDVVDRAAVAAFADQIYARFGAVHLLCNNAGVVTFDLMDDISDADWRWVIGVNLEGVVNGLQAFLPRMKAQSGEKHIVNTGSIAGIGPHKGIAPYVATKYAVVGISETLHDEREELGIGCSVLCPGNVDTQIVASGRNRQDSVGGPDRRVNKEVQAQISQGMDPMEVGRIVRQAVIDDDLYIFTHPDTREIAQTRFDAILAAFDKCAARSQRASGTGGGR